MHDFRRKGISSGQAISEWTGSLSQNEQSSASNDILYRCLFEQGYQMQSVALLDAETARYGALAEELKQSFQGIDDETLADTLEGLSNLPELLQAVVRSSLLDEAFALGLKGRLGR